MTTCCTVNGCSEPIDLDLGPERGGWCAAHRWRPEKAMREGMRSVYPVAGVIVPIRGWAAREDARRRQLNLFDTEQQDGER